MGEPLPPEHSPPELAAAGGRERGLRHAGHARPLLVRHGEEGHEELLFDTLRSLRSIAEAEKLTMLELSLAWPLHNPAVSCIIAGITKDEHVQSNAAASKVQLSAECLAKVDEATTALKNAMGSNADLWQGGADGRIK